MATQNPARTRTHAHTHTHTKKKCGPPSACPWAAPRKGFGGLSGARGPPRMYMRRRSGGLRRPLWPARRRQRHSVLARHGWGWGKAVTGHATFPSGHVTPKTHSNQKKHRRGRRAGEITIPTSPRKHAVRNASMQECMQYNWNPNDDAKKAAPPRARNPCPILSSRTVGPDVEWPR